MFGQKDWDVVFYSKLFRWPEVDVECDGVIRD